MAAGPGLGAGGGRLAGAGAAALVAPRFRREHTPATRWWCAAWMARARNSACARTKPFWMPVCAKAWPCRTNAAMGVRPVSVQRGARQHRPPAYQRSAFARCAEGPGQGADVLRCAAWRRRDRRGGFYRCRRPGRRGAHRHRGATGTPGRRCHACAAATARGQDAGLCCRPVHRHPAGRRPAPCVLVCQPAPCQQPDRAAHSPRARRALYDPCVRGDAGGDDVLRFEGPRGSFTLRESTHPILFVAGATGFAPIKSIVEDAFERGVRPMRLYWGVRQRKDLYLLALCEQWARTTPTSPWCRCQSPPRATAGRAARDWCTRPCWPIFPISAATRFTCAAL